MERLAVKFVGMEVGQIVESEERQRREREEKEREEREKLDWDRGHWPGRGTRGQGKERQEVGSQG